MCSELFCSCHCSVEPLWRQRRTFISSCHTQDCNSTGILPVTECDLILTDGADELRCAAAFFYSSSAEILKTFSWASFPIMIWAFSRTAADASSCPGSIGLPWPQPAPPEALALAHLSLWKTGPLCKYRLLWPYFGFVFFFPPCLPAVIDAPTLCSGGSPAGFKREAHRGFVVQSQEDQIQVENSRHLCSPYKLTMKQNNLSTCFLKKHVVPTSLMEFEEAQQETGAQGPFMVDWQHWDCSGLLTSMMPVKHLCILKWEKWSSLFYVQRVLQEWLDSSVILIKLTVIPLVGNSFMAYKTVKNKPAVVSVYPEITPVLARMINITCCK